MTDAQHAKNLMPFLQRADELQNHDKRMAYYCVPLAPHAPRIACARSTAQAPADVRGAASATGRPHARGAAGHADPWARAGADEVPDGRSVQARGPFLPPGFSPRAARPPGRLACASRRPTRRHEG